MPFLSATTGRYGPVENWYELLFIAAVMGIGFIGRYWRLVVQWLEGIRGRDWAMTSAVIDIVSVVPQIVETRHGDRTVGYLATLTYFYRNPELQCGDYSRVFSTESEGQVWAASYKGRSVIVNVDPRDPSRSVLRKEQLSTYGSR